MSSGRVKTICNDVRRPTHVTPHGCCAQAWSIAEVLRCFVKTSGQAERAEEPSMVTEMVT